jgi:hypothetical protein
MAHCTFLLSLSLLLSNKKEKGGNSPSKKNKKGKDHSHFNSMSIIG